MNRRIDAFVMDWQAYRHLRRKHGATTPEFVACRLPLPEMAYHIVAARAAPDAVAAIPAIDRAISALRRDGTLAALMRDDLDPTPPPAGTLQSRVAPG
jgi:ABC-type amino acid transport substrate-binding protein